MYNPRTSGTITLSQPILVKELEGEVSKLRFCQPGGLERVGVEEEYEGKGKSKAQEGEEEKVSVIPGVQLEGGYGPFNAWSIAGWEKYPKDEMKEFPRAKAILKVVREDLKAGIVDLEEWLGFQWRQDVSEFGEGEEDTAEKSDEERKLEGDYTFLGEGV